MVRISDGSIPEKAHTEITAPDDVLIPLADVQSAVPGSAGKLTVTELTRATQSLLVTSAGHGLLSGDVGKPLAGAAVFDDTLATNYPSWVLTQVIDDNNLRVVRSGVITFSSGLMAPGYTVASDGPYVYWDASEGLYTGTRPSDSAPAVREVLYVVGISGGTVTAEVLSWGPTGSGSASDVQYVPIAADEIGADNTFCFLAIEAGVSYKFPLSQLKNVVQGAIRPEYFGAAGDGTTDDTLAMQAWADYIATQTSGRFTADGLYRVTDTITFDDITGVTMSIGCATLDALNYRSTDPPSRSGILYDGSAGTGPEPQNCKPAVHIKRLNFAVIDQIVVAQHKDTAETNTTGILLSAGDSNQRGNSRIGTLYAGNFYRGIIVGLRNYSGGLIGHTAGYTDDVFEACHVSQMIAAGCPAPIKFACFSSDQSVIGQLYADPYLPNYYTGDLGLATYAIDIEYAGNLQIHSIGCFHVRLGQSKQQVDSIDTNTITIASHGLSNGNVVYIYPALGATLPTGLFDIEQLYFVVQTTTNTFKLSKTSGGEPVTFTNDGSGDVWVVRVDNTEASLRVGDCTVDIKRFAAENHHCYALSDTFSVTGRNIQQIENLNCNYGNKQANKFAVKLSRPWRLVNCSFGGHVWHSDAVDAVSPIFLLDRDSLATYGFSKNGAAPEPIIVGGRRSKNWDTDAVTSGTVNRVVYSGFGAPESVITAPIGSLYLRTDGIAGETLYVKESGTGNTGWAAK